MKNQNAYDKARDQSAADREAYAKGFTPEQMCTAQGCPSRWIVDSDDKGIHKLCGAHAWAEPNRWPEITQRLQWEETERAQKRGEVTA